MTAQQVELIAAEKAQASSSSQDTSIGRLFKALSHRSSRCVVLFPSDEAVVVVDFPTRPNAAGEKCENGFHLLFQLQPRIHFLRGTSPSPPLMEYIKTEDMN